jgi:aminopeptidase
MDPRTETLAYQLIHYSVHLKKSEKILIEIFDDGQPLARAIVREVYKVGGIPFLTIKNNRLQRELLMQASKEQMMLIAEYESMRMKHMDAYLAVRTTENANELSDVPSDRMSLYQTYWSKPVHSEIRVPHTKWCVMRYPNPAMAQLASMSTSAFTDFYYSVCNLDYAKMNQAMTPLIKLMQKTDKVHITGPGTNLIFSIKGIPAIKCSGTCNIPDGEVYTAPVQGSINGTLTYNTPAIYQGVTYENIALTFKNGRIVSASSNHTKEINKIFDTDNGARSIGEFSFGLNPYIHTPMKDTLFDEKICGSFHFTPGNAYDEADNGNRSAIHWDLVCIQTPEYGGGEIYLDDVLVRKNGCFVLDELRGLNPENLK